MLRHEKGNVMGNTGSDQMNRHARMFALLRQKQVGSTLADRAAPVAERYLDDAAASPMIHSAVASLRAPAAAKTAAGKPSLAKIFHPAKASASKES